MKRVFGTDYRAIEGDAEPSDESDVESWLASSSYVSAVEVSEEVQFQLLDKADSNLMWQKKVEKCHLKSQSQFPEVKNNVNNLLYMTRHLHEHFDGFGVTEMVPSFLVRYVKHNAEGLQKSISGKSVTVYEATVHVQFRDEEGNSILCQHFREYKRVNPTTIEFQLYLPNPNEFQEFADHKAEETLCKWRSLAGVDGDGDGNDCAQSAGGASNR